MGTVNILHKQDLGGWPYDPYQRAMFVHIQMSDDYTAQGDPLPLEQLGLRQVSAMFVSSVNSGGGDIPIPVVLGTRLADGLSPYPDTGKTALLNGTRQEPSIQLFDGGNYTEVVAGTDASDHAFWTIIVGTQ